MPEIQLDYAFVRKEEEQELATILVMKDRESKAVITNLVQSKGRGFDDTVQRVVTNVRRLGHRGRLIIKTDGENALMDLREAVMEALAQTCIPIRPHKTIRLMSAPKPTE